MKLIPKFQNSNKTSTKEQIKKTIISYQNGGNMLSQEDKNRLWDYRERFGADKSKEHYFNFWNFQKGNQEVSNYFNSYLNSPGFNRIINNQNKWWESRHPYKKFYSNPDKGTQAWFKAARKVNPYLYTVDMYSDQSTTLYNTNVGGQRSIFIGRRNSEFPQQFVIGHEYLHGKAPFNNIGNNPLFNPESAQAEALKQNTNTKNRHDSQQDEKHADNWGLKYLFYKEGIYDSRSNKDINIKQVKQLRQKYPNLRPFQQMSDEQIMFQINNVATNSIKSPKINDIRLYQKDYDIL